MVGTHECSMLTSPNQFRNNPLIEVRIIIDHIIFFRNTLSNYDYRGINQLFTCNLKTLQMVRDDFVPVDSELVSMNAEEEDAQVDSHLIFRIMLDVDVQGKASTQSYYNRWYHNE